MDLKQWLLTLFTEPLTSYFLLPSVSVAETGLTENTARYMAGKPLPGSAIACLAC